MLMTIFKTLSVVVIHVTILKTNNTHYTLVTETGSKKSHPSTNIFSRHIWKKFYSLDAQPQWQLVYKLFLQAIEYFSLLELPFDKPGCAKGHGRRNPTASAIKALVSYLVIRIFLRS